MRAWESALAIAVCAMGLGLLPAAHAQFKPSPAPGGPGGGSGPGTPTAPQVQGDQFQFKVCNRSKIPLFVAMLYKVGGNSWRTVGWVNYKPGTCGPARLRTPLARLNTYGKLWPVRPKPSGRPTPPVE